MYTTTLVVTVGISLITNYSRTTGREPDEDSLLDFLREKGRAASAEVNTIDGVVEERGLSPGETIVVLLYSETKEAELCALVLEKYLSERGFGVLRRVVRGLRYEEERFTKEGLWALVNELSDTIVNHKREGRRVILCATGGFKPEMAYATIVAFLHKVEVFYIHEKFRKVVALEPLMPLNVPREFWERYGRVLDFLRMRRSYEELKAKFPEVDVQAPEIRGLVDVEESEEGRFVRLSPMGLALLMAKNSLI